MKQKQTIAIFIFLFALVACFSVWSNRTDTVYKQVSSNNAVWDLREIDFSKENVKLTGSPEYISNALLTPEQFAKRENEAIIAEPDNATQYATSRLRILLPEGSYYTFSCNSIDFAERLYINGELFMEIGKPGTTKESVIPDTAKIIVTVHPVNGVVELVQQSSNFVHREGGGFNGWFVGPPSLSQARASGGLETAIILGCYLALFLVHLMLYFMLQRYRANLIFALFSLTWLLRTGVTRQKIFSSLIPSLSWAVKFRIEYMAFPITAAFLIALLHVLFPRVLQKGFLYAVYGVTVITTGIFLFTDTVFMSYSMPVVQIIYGLAILYILVRLVMKLRKPTTEQLVFLSGLLLFFVSNIWDMFFYNNIVRFTILNSERSMLVFAFFAAAAVFIATMREVENAKAQEQRLAIENAALERVSRLKTDLMQTISHEMRTPLAVMVGFAELTAEDARNNSVTEETALNLDVIAAEGKRMADMLEEIRGMALAKEFPKEKHPLSSEDVIGQITGLYAKVLERRGTTLSVEIENGLPHIFGNEAELTQVMFNLLRNADRHTENGTVGVCAELKDGMIQVAVTDTGSGVPAELLPHVFKRGMTGSEGGTGLGLSICKDIIEAHGGEIWLESEEGEGTTASFTLPPIKEVDVI